MEPILLPSVGPFSRTDSDIFTQSGVFSLEMGIAQKVVESLKNVVKSIFEYLAFSIGYYGDLI